MRLPTSWERVVPSARPTPVTSCPPYSCRGRPLSGAALSRRVPLRRRRYGSPSSARGGCLDPLLCDQSPGITRATEGQKFGGRTGPYAAGPRRPAKQGLVAISGSTERSTDGRHCPCGQGIRLSRRVLPPPLFFECGSYPRRKGAVRCKAGELHPCPSAGRMGPTSQRLFQPRPHAVTSRRDRAANVRAGVPSAGDGRPGRPTIG